MSLRDKVTTRCCSCKDCFDIVVDVLKRNPDLDIRVGSDRSLFGYTDRGNKNRCPHFMSNILHTAHCFIIDTMNIRIIGSAIDYLVSNNKMTNYFSTHYLIGLMRIVLEIGYVSHDILCELDKLKGYAVLTELHVGSPCVSVINSMHLLAEYGLFSEYYANRCMIIMHLDVECMKMCIARGAVSNPSLVFDCDVIFSRTNSYELVELLIAIRFIGAKHVNAFRKIYERAVKKYRRKSGSTQTEKLKGLNKIKHLFNITKTYQTNPDIYEDTIDTACVRTWDDIGLCYHEILLQTFKNEKLRNEIEEIKLKYNF